MIPIALLIALAGAPPSVSLASICQSAQAAALPEDKKAAYDSCVRDENDALDRLRAKWAHYSAAARAACVGSDAVTLSYVELLTCLEMQPGGSLSLQGADDAASTGAGVAPLKRPPKQ
ncbi:MAG: hypothetical protein ACLPGW_09050 [Roseiarcus sp.]